VLGIGASAPFPLHELNTKYDPRLGPFGYAVLSIKRVVVFFILGVDKPGPPGRDTFGHSLGKK